MFQKNRTNSVLKQHKIFFPCDFLSIIQPAVETDKAMWLLLSCFKKLQVLGLFSPANLLRYFFEVCTKCGCQLR